MPHEHIDEGMKQPFRTRMYVGIAILIAAVIFLIASATRSASQYYLTIDELLLTWEEVPDRTYRISGVVDGDTIEYDELSADLRFSMAHIPADMKEIERMGGLTAVLNAAVSNPQAQRLVVEYNGSQPDLLGHAVQAIVTGHMQPDQVFLADEILLKCPSKYEPVVTEQME